MTSTPEQRAIWRDRKRHQVARRREQDRQFERCGRCGYARINVIHEADREHAPEGLAYYADIPFCEFLPTGQRVR